MYWTDFHDSKGRFVMRIESEKPVVYSQEVPGQVEVLLLSNPKITFYAAGMSYVLIEQTEVQLDEPAETIQK
jgi:hypothetical protein